MNDSRGPSRPAFLLRVGTLMVAPGRALADIQARERGGVGDALAILLLGVLCFHLPAAARAVLMVREASVAGTLAQLLGIVGQDLRPAMLVALSAGIAISVLAGRGRRDPGLDIELGAACSIPYLLLSGLAELAGSRAFLAAVANMLNLTIQVIALAWALVILVFGVRLARSRSSGGASRGNARTGRAAQARRRGRDHRGRLAGQCACPEHRLAQSQPRCHCAGRPWSSGARFRASAY